MSEVRTLFAVLLRGPSISGACLVYILGMAWSSFRRCRANPQSSSLGGRICNVAYRSVPPIFRTVDRFLLCYPDSPSSHLPCMVRRLRRCSLSLPVLWFFPIIVLTLSRCIYSALAPPNGDIGLAPYDGC